MNLYSIKDLEYMIIVGRKGQSLKRFKVPTRHSNFGKGDTNIELLIVRGSRIELFITVDNYVLAVSTMFCSLYRPTHILLF